MSKNFFVLSLLVVLAMILAFAGCSDDSTPTGGGSDINHLQLVDITEVIKSVSPPVYTASVSAPAADSFEIWTQGDYPLLEKVFGNEDPQTLYRNIEDFKTFMEMVNEIVRVDGNGNVILGSYSQAVTDSFGGQEMTITFTTEVTALDAATTIPTAQQAIIGASVDLDYLVTVSSDELTDGSVQVGLKIDSAQQTLLVFQTNMSGEEDHDESSLVYASMDPRDSSFVFKGVCFVEYTDEVFSTSFKMTSEDAGDFAYQMSWYSDNIPAPDYTLLGCIIGGGDKDDEFALKYRQYTPADDTEIDAEWSFDQVFGTNYSEGTGLITEYSDYVNESLIIGYSAVPQATVVSPWAE